ncbi:MAG: outer membrane protein transport protein [Gammaproteobacteria bacterium]|nr:outer membrane protein transport protein [Gammaproteobacteria bacterium]MBU0848999.1 outer membrane protein transport protein [Gammaproteobacteria bacterium]MBU1266709.1 outer membrane protein transport protein [Gammaproteobacteria bacterium]MBU1527993.1 outer membrane protein transport protein [Gammaproteobacteria bacterium]MBU1781336.1 outer membrane protein transport protein [Gammaproteobacteria bacterium]
MKQTPFQLRVINCAVATLGLGFSGFSSAAGFALNEQNASGAGVAYAGTAAIGEDASAAWFNPASMSRLKQRQMVLGAHYIDLNGEVKDEGSTAAPGRPLGNSAGEFGDEGYIPNFHLVIPFNDRINFGLSVTTPFGLKTDFQPDWYGRFQGVTSDIKSVNINPSASYKVNELWSVGAGVSAQKLDAKLSSQINYAPFGGTEGLSTIAGDGWGYGFNLGVMGQVTPSTRVGVAYRSAIEQHLEGNVTFDNRPAAGPAATLFANSELTSKIRLPASFAISSVTELTPKWQLLTDATWTEWSTIQELDFLRQNAPAGAATLTVQDYEWKNSWRFAVGGIYKYSDTINLKTGIAYDITPVPDERRKVRLPDENRITLAVGSQYQFDKATTFDLAFQYVMPDKARIDSTEGNPAAGQQTRVLGRAEADAFILSGQMSYKF